MEINQNDLEVREKLLEHRYRLDTMEGLIGQHNEELATLSASLTELKDALNASINKFIIVLCVIVGLGQSAGPIISSLIGS